MYQNVSYYVHIEIYNETREKINKYLIRLVKTLN